MNVVRGALLVLVLLVFVSACNMAPPASPTLVSPVIPSPVPNTPVPPTQTPTAESISEASIAEIRDWLAGLTGQDLFTGSILIAQQGKILLAEGYNLADRANKLPNTASTRYQIGSITKQFTAMAVMILAGQGKLGIEDPICAYLNDCPASWETMTIHHLLTHTSGISNYTDLPPDFWSTGGTPKPPGQIEENIKSLPLDFQPGQSWSYSNTGYLLLGRIIEQVSGQTYEEFLQQNVFTPLALHNTGFDDPNSNLAIGYINSHSNIPAVPDLLPPSPPADGGLISTIEDLYHWEQALYTDQLAPREYIAAMLSPQVSVPNSDGMSYGYGWFVGEVLGRTVQFHDGVVNGFYCTIIRYPDDQITLILLMNRFNVQRDMLLQVLMSKMFGLN